MRTIVQPPQSSGDPAFATGWWHDDADTGRIICDLCPRACNMKPGDRGFCFVRQNVDGQMALTTYGKSTGFCIDPIEKKPLNHFYPGTAVLSFGTAGCNLGCKFCQNWDISKSREVERLSQLATPDTIAVAAKATNCRSVAFTYNDPIIWAEYAIDTAEACRREGVKSVAVTAGYISPAARPAFFHAMDAANVDLKAFTEEFYHKITYSQLQPVLDTLRWLKHESDVWFEITNLLIPDANDSPDEVRRMCDWILEAVGADVPVHFTAFHPDFRMTDRGRTPHETLLQAKQIAIEQGIRFAYVGNVNDVKNQSTWCPSCQHLLIKRNHYQLGAYHVANSCCANCGQAIAGHFENHPGNWGAKRQPIRISDHAPSNLVTLNTPPTQTSRLPVETPMPENAAVIRNPVLTSVQESAIHKLASEIVAAAIHQRSVDSEILDAVNHEGTGAITVMGAFVTLKSNGHLRACCGMVGQPVPLLQAVRHAAARTATEDHRFPPVSPVELRHLTLDVTLLFNFEPLSQQGEARFGAVEVGRHGLKIVRGDKAGLLLPSVAVDAGWDSRTFLNQVCRKAGLPVTAWLEADSQLLRFEGHMIEGTFNDSVLLPREDRPAFDMTQNQVDALCRFAKSNIIAHVQGAKTVDELISVTASLAGTRTDTANVYSFEARSSTNNISDSNVPQPQAGPNVRPAAVAGTFYPADPVEFSQAVDDCFAACTAPDQIVSAAAVMVPHAGLRFSGRFAADVLNHIKIPDTVIIIGPKHTRAGVDWAVAPHESWQLPGCTVAADVSLAAKLASQIDGLELDAAAHAAEHSTEVILPLLACVAPKVKVVSIAMGGATFEQCQTFASQLAKVIQELPSMPLLIISSDMNHFATDAENRRLDEMALTAMETKDPQRLLDVVTSNNISMCGVIPAVVVMQTLLAMEVIPNMQRVGYGTSADAGGNPDRVVGYAGVILGD